MDNDKNQTLLDIVGSMSDQTPVYDYGDWSNQDDEINPETISLPDNFIGDTLEAYVDDATEESDVKYCDEQGVIYDKKGSPLGMIKQFAPYLIPGVAPLLQTKKLLKFAKKKVKGSSKKSLAKAIDQRNEKLNQFKAQRPMLMAKQGNAIDTVFGLGWLSRVVDNFAKNKRMIECMYGVERLCVTVGVLMHRYPDAKSIREKAMQVSLGSLAKSVVSATAVGGVATVALIATDQYWGGIVSVTDSQLNANYRPVTVVMTGTGIDTFTFIVWPKIFRWYIAYLMNRQAQGYASITRGLDATATIAADGVRAGAVLTHEGLNERDLGGIL